MMNNNFNNGTANNNNNSNNNGGFIMAQGTITTMEAFAGTVKTAMEVYYGEDSLMTELFHMQEQADEYVYMLAFNNRMKLLGIFEVSHGIGNASLLDARGVFIRALQIAASNVMLVHNHPSGIPLPSREDFNICKRMVSAGDLLGVPVLDFIVIGSDDFVSFREKELL